MFVHVIMANRHMFVHVIMPKRYMFVNVIMPSTQIYTYTCKNVLCLCACVIPCYQALEMAALATESNQFKDWWWKVQLAKCYYRSVTDQHHLKHHNVHYHLKEAGTV